MYYQSTRSSHTANSLEAVIRGIAPDGGCMLTEYHRALL